MRSKRSRGHQWQIAFLLAGTCMGGMPHADAMTCTCVHISTPLPYGCDPPCMLNEFRQSLNSLSLPGPSLSVCRCVCDNVNNLLLGSVIGLKIEHEER